MTNIDEKYTYYPTKVFNGEITACNYIKLAAKRFFDFLNRDDLEFRAKKVDHVTKFISNLTHYTGKSNGKPFILSDWQFFIVCNIFGFYYKGTNKRVCKNAYIEVGRKNGKSALISAIALYCLIADGENGAEIDCVANSRQQAKILFDMAANFSKTLDSKQKFLKQYRDKIKFDATSSYMQVLASDAATLDGYNSSLFVQDELHQAPNSKLYDVLKSSMGMRENPLAICITSAGFNKFSFCYEMRKTCIEIINNVKQDDSQFTAIYCIDENDNWDDEKVWQKANPNLDVTVTSEYIREQVLAAKNNSSLEVSVRTKNLGEWLSSSDIWINNDIILKSTQKINLEDFRDNTAYMGIDLASVSDLTSVTVMILKDEKYYFKSWYYLPSSALEDNSNSELYKKWKREGYLITTDGNVTDYDVVLRDILKINGITPLEKIAYDKFNATQFCINAVSEGLPMIPFSQALWSFNLGTKEIERLIKSDKVVIDDNPITRFCFSNVILKFDWNENCKPTKAENQNKIDGVISMIESLGIFLETPNYNNQILAI